MVNETGGLASTSRAEFRPNRSSGGAGAARGSDTMPKTGSESGTPTINVASRIRERTHTGTGRDQISPSPSKGPHSHVFSVDVGACCQSNVVASLNPLCSYSRRRRWIFIQRLIMPTLIALGIAIALVWNGDSSRTSVSLSDLSTSAEIKHLKLKTSWRKSSPLNNPHSIEQIKEIYHEIFDLLPAEGFDSNFTTSSCWITNTVTPGTNQTVEKLQCIPSLYLIGVAKSGTTDIWMRLSRHPDFAKCRSIGACGHNVKEPHYWTLGDRHIYWRDSVLGYQPMRYKSQTVKNPTAGNTRSARGSPNYQVKLEFQNYIDFYKGFTPSLLKSPKKALIDASTDIFTFCCNGFPGASEPLKDNKTMKLEEFITTPEIMKAVIPNPRILLLLRDPVTRLWSDYMYFNRSGNVEAKNPMTFHKDCQNAVTQLNECLAKASEIEGLNDLPLFLKGIGRSEFAIPNHKIPSFRAYLRCTDNGGWRDPEIAPARKALLQCPLHVSLYYYNMQFWMSTFDDEFMVIRTEDYRASPWTEIDRVFDHFGLREPTLPEWRMIHDTCNKGHCNEGKYHKAAGDSSHESSGSPEESSNGIILQETEEMLRAFYAPYNEHLAILLDDEGFLWTADQIKEDKLMAEIALQADPMEITLRNAEEKRKARNGESKNLRTASNRDQLYHGTNGRRGSSYVSFLYGDGESKHMKSLSQNTRTEYLSGSHEHNAKRSDLSNLVSHARTARYPEKTQVSDIVTGKVSKRPKD